jgi:hypothetical protein
VLRAGPPRPNMYRFDTLSTPWKQKSHRAIRRRASHWSCSQVCTARSNLPIRHLESPEQTLQIIRKEPQCAAPILRSSSLTSSLWCTQDGRSNQPLYAKPEATCSNLVWLILVQTATINTSNNSRSIAKARISKLVMVRLDWSSRLDLFR